MEVIQDCVPLGDNFVMLRFSWNGVPPKAGQFFMLRPEMTSVFLGRPVSVAGWSHFDRLLTFLVELRGPGTKELAALQAGDRVQLTGPLGNGWLDKIRAPRRVALVSGGIGIAPLLALGAALENEQCTFFSGFRTFPVDKNGDFALAPALPGNVEPVIATDDGSGGRQGSVVDLVDPYDYEALYVCGSVPMIKAMAAKAQDSHIPCYVSMERRMACGVGACMGCNVHTRFGNLRCCADGPIFDAAEVIFG